MSFDRLRRFFSENGISPPSVLETAWSRPESIPRRCQDCNFYVDPEAILSLNQGLRVILGALGAEEQAEGLIRATLKRKGWTEKDLQERRKRGQFKLRLAEELRAETTVTLRWIAARLCNGTR